MNCTLNLKFSLVNTLKIKISVIVEWNRKIALNILVAFVRLDQLVLFVRLQEVKVGSL